MSSCAAPFYSCVCKLASQHKGPHLCDCEGSWDDDGDIVEYPQVMVASDGIFPQGSRMGKPPPEYYGPMKED